MADPTPPEKACHICGGTIEVKACARCKKVSYCSKACQKADWKTHKQSCTPHPSASGSGQFDSYSRSYTFLIDTSVPQPKLFRTLSAVITKFIAQSDRVFGQTLTEAARVVVVFWSILIAPLAPKDLTLTQLADRCAELAEVLAPALDSFDESAKKALQYSDDASNPLSPAHEHHWLHDLDAKKTTAILLDTFRLMTHEGNVFGPGIIREEFWASLVMKAKTKNLIPSCLNLKACTRLVQSGRDQGKPENIYHSLSAAEVNQKYENKFMALQMLVFAAQVTGTSLWPHDRAPHLGKAIEAAVLCIRPESEAELLNLAAHLGDGLIVREST